MEIKLKPIKPSFRKRLKSGISPWCVAAIVGLFGTWFSGTTVDHRGAGFMNQQLTVAITPLTGIITLVWLVIAFWWYRETSTRAGAYRTAVQDKPDYFMLDEFGATWGVVDVTSTKVAWTAIGFYRLTKSKTLALGLPAGTVEVAVDELEGASANALEALFQSKGIKKIA